MKKITFLLTLLLVASCATHDATKNHDSNAGITMQTSMVTVRHSNLNSIGYVAALKTALDDNAIEQTYGVRPGLIEGEIDQRKFEKGTVIVDLIEPVSGRLIWRGAGQSLATLEDIPPELRKQRVHQFIKNLFSALPGELQ